MPNHDRLNRQDPSFFKTRFVIVGCLIFFAFCLLGGRVWYLQVLRGDELRTRSENNRIRVEEIKPLRGLILDRYGATLVDNHPSFDIAVIPQETENVGRAVELLHEFSRDFCPPATLADGTALRRGYTPVTLERDVSWEKVALVETYSTMLPGVIIDVVPVRNYTMGDATAHALGYVGEISRNELQSPAYRDYRRGAILGKSGIERTMDRYLRGKSGGAQVEVNVAGRTLNVLAKVDAVPGLNVVTTLDKGLQQACWEAFDSPAGSVVVMDPNDGSILAMVSKPSYDPNLFNRGISETDWERFSSDPRAPFKNRALSAHYPPASLIKPLIAAAALDQGLITGEETIMCLGSLSVGDRTFRCWERKGHGALNLYQAIVRSCDVYFYTLGLQMGIDVIAEYAYRFGLGKVTGVEVAGERPGLVPSTQWKRQRFGEPWHRGETVSVSIGQGFLSATPLQLVRFYAAMTNGGVLYQPRLVERVESPGGDIVESFPAIEQGRLPVSREHLEQVKRALWGAVNEPRGTGKALLRKERDVCGKTGTAQVISMPDDDDDGEKQKDIPYRFRDHALFVCSVPCDDPLITVMVVVEHGGHGGSAAAPIARKIVDWYMENRVMRAPESIMTGSYDDTSTRRSHED